MLSKPTTRLIWAAKYRRRVLVGSVEVRLEDILKMIADQCGFALLAARVHGGDHVHVFVSAPPKASIPEMVRVFSARARAVLNLNPLRMNNTPYVLRVVPCSHEAVRLWVNKLEQVTVNVEARPRRIVAVDETKIKADGEWCYVWDAIDVDTRVSFSPFPGRGT